MQVMKHYGISYWPVKFATFNKPKLGTHELLLCVPGFYSSIVIVQYSTEIEKE